MAVEVQLKGFPEWTEKEDLQATIQECGWPIQYLNLVPDPTNHARIFAEFGAPHLEAARTIVQQLHKFEFTPGYPLSARVKPDQPALGTHPDLPAASSGYKGGGKGKDFSKDGTNDLSKGKGKGNQYKGLQNQGSVGGGYGYGQDQAQQSQEENAMPEVDENDPEFGIKNCVGAGRLEGWFLNARQLVMDRGFGHIQSYCFEGNLVYRPVNSPLLKDIPFLQRDNVEFEVIMINNQAEAVRIITSEQKEEGVDPQTPIIPEAYLPSVAEEQRPSEQPAMSASERSQKRREREEQDPRLLFFGGFGPEISEDTLRRFAEQAGKVTKVKIFLNTTTWRSKGCAKVQYDTVEDAERALNELEGTVLNERIVGIEKMGGERQHQTAKRQKGPAQTPAKPQNHSDDTPKQLPLSMFSGYETDDQKLEMCIAAFEDLLRNHDSEKTGRSVIFMIRHLVVEVNDLFGEDETSLKKWLDHLKKCQWFWDNGQIPKWQESRRRVHITKAGKNQPDYLEFARNTNTEVEQRKLEMQLMGKTIFQVPEEEARQARKDPDAWKGEKGKGKGKGGWKSKW